MSDSDSDDDKQIGPIRNEDHKASQILFEEEEKVDPSMNPYKVEGYVEKARKDSSSSDEEELPQAQQESESEYESEEDSSSSCDSFNSSENLDNVLPLDKESLDS